jgi:hypothetical protein
MPTLPRRYDVPTFPDRELLFDLVSRGRVGLFNFFFIVGLCLLPLAAFIGWTFSAKEYLRVQEFCERDSVGMQSAKALCLAREQRGVEVPPTDEALERKCGDVSAQMSAFDWCSTVASGDGLGEAGQFAIGAAVVGLFGAISLLVGILDRRSVPHFVRVLREPRRIVWIYECDLATSRLGYVRVSRSVQVGLESGEVTTLASFDVAFGGIESADGVQLASRMLAAVVALAPSASVGWSPEASERFRQQPRSLAVARTTHSLRQQVAA